MAALFAGIGTAAAHPDDPREQGVIGVWYVDATGIEGSQKGLTRLNLSISQSKLFADLMGSVPPNVQVAIPGVILVTPNAINKFYYKNAVGKCVSFHIEPTRQHEVYAVAWNPSACKP
ncbi:hypothetical protein [Gordonia sp. AC31]|uniref:hypothetical protein n=1 Tax=Gordonia sp. AC31 TaxID=2962571 RepID=UPI0028819272|nr:hypothetical protein [Gordonia sp. AC31]MDT0221496.1 hypothetical protein [Gordonia sp. AC31]